MTLEELCALADAIRAEMGKAVHGQDDVVNMLLVALLARGHVLIERVRYRLLRWRLFGHFVVPC